MCCSVLEPRTHHTCHVFVSSARIIHTQCVRIYIYIRTHTGTLHVPEHHIFVSAARGWFCLARLIDHASVCVHVYTHTSYLENICMHSLRLYSCTTCHLCMFLSRYICILGFRIWNLCQCLCVYVYSQIYWFRGSWRIFGYASVTLAQWRRARDSTNLGYPQVPVSIPAENLITQINMNLSK